MEDSLKHIDPNSLKDISSLRNVLTLVLQAMESMSKELSALKEENGKLQDEINRLKGEKGRPEFKSKPKVSEGDRSEPAGTKKDGRGNHKTGTNKRRLKIDQTIELKDVLVALPSDARIKFWEERIVQDIELKRNTVKYRIAVWYSPSERKTYPSSFPLDGFGSFGPQIRGLLHLLHYECNVTQGCLESFCGSLGLDISSGSIDNLLKSRGQEAVLERKEILAAGIAHSDYVQADSTGSKEKGASLYTQIFCSPLFTAYFSNRTKSRLQVLQSLCGLTELAELPVMFNEDTVFLLEHFKVPQRCQDALRMFLAGDGCSSIGALKLWITKELPKLNGQKNALAHVLDAFALAHYFQREDFPTLSALMSDDAPEYKLLSPLHALCWVHDGRDYKKLLPHLDINRQQNDVFRNGYWDFYRKLLEYKTLDRAAQTLQKPVLDAEFDRIFTQKTGYEALDKLIARTCSKKTELLLVLAHPKLPLHNNAAELAARRKVRKRDVCLHTMSAEGTRAQDAYLSIIETAKKLGVSAFEYLTDFVSGTRNMIPLPKLIACRKLEGTLEF